MFAGPCRDNGTQRGIITDFAGSSLPPHLVHTTVLYGDVPFLEQVSHLPGWPKNSFMFFHTIFWKNTNGLFNQPNTFFRQWGGKSKLLPESFGAWLFSAHNNPHAREAYIGVSNFALLQTLQWKRKWQPTSVFFPGESRGQRSPAGYSP